MAEVKWEAESFPQASPFPFLLLPFHLTPPIPAHTHVPPTYTAAREARHRSSFFFRDHLGFPVAPSVVLQNTSEQGGARQTHDEANSFTGNSSTLTPPSGVSGAAPFPFRSNSLFAHSFFSSTSIPYASISGAIFFRKPTRASPTKPSCTGAYRRGTTSISNPTFPLFS